jgi:hypothetical protein
MSPVNIFKTAQDAIQLGTLDFFCLGKSAGRKHSTVAFRFCSGSF